MNMLKKISGCIFLAAAVSFGTAAQAQSSGVPGKPTVTAKRVSATSIRLNWTAPATNSAGITNYYVRWRTTAGPGTWQNANGDDADCANGASNPGACGQQLGNVMTYTVTGLTSGTRYDFQARAQNASGAGSWSDNVELTSQTPATTATLSALVVNDGASDLTLTPAFAAATTSYTASVRGGITSVGVTPTAANDATFVVKKSGTSVGTAGKVSVSLDLGENNIAIDVTSEDGNTEQTYDLTLTRRQPLSDKTLSGLAVPSGVTLSPAFDAAVLSYTAEVRSSRTGFAITPTANDAAGASIKVGRAGFLAAVDSGSASAQTLDRTGGNAAQDASANIFLIEVTAEDGTSQSYEIAVSRLAVSTDATLSALAVPSGVTLTPAFDAAVLSYTADIRSPTSNFGITPTVNDAEASIKVGRSGFLAAVDSGSASNQGITKSSGGEAQDASANTFLIEVTAEDGSTQTYEIAVSRLAVSDDASLSALTVSQGSLSPAFATGVTSYDVAIGNNVAQFTLTPTATDSAASIQVGRDGFLGSASTAQGTEVGGSNNIFLVVVTAEDGSTTLTYTVKVFRAGAITKLLIHDASLASASRNDGNSLLAAAAFDPLVPAYSLVVQRSVREVVITPTFSAGAVQYQRTKPTVTPASLTSIATNTASASIPLAGGENLILVKVHTADYPITILRPADGPENLSAASRDGRLRLTWDAIDGTSGYRVRWRTKTGPGAWQSESGNDDDGEAVGTAPRYTIPGLTNATTYQVQARADNAAGDGEWSASVEAAPAEGLAIVSQPPDLVFLAGEALAQPVQLPGAQRGQTPYTFSLTGLPAGLEFNAAADTREITGTPTTETAAPVEVTYRVTDANSDFDERVFTVSIVTFNLDVDESGAEDGRDGILIARYLLGVRGAALPDKQSAAGADAVEAEIKAGADTKLLDVNADGNADGEDGILVARYMFGLRGAELVAGFSGVDADAVAAKIAELLP